MAVTAKLRVGKNQGHGTGATHGLTRLGRPIPKFLGAGAVFRRTAIDSTTSCIFPTSY